MGIAGRRRGNDGRDKVVRFSDGEAARGTSIRRDRPRRRALAALWLPRIRTRDSIASSIRPRLQ